MADWLDVDVLKRARYSNLVRLAQSLGIRDPWSLSRHALSVLTYRVMCAHRSHS